MGGKIFLVVLILITLCGCSNDLFPESDNPQQVYESFWNQFNRNYAYFNLATFDRDSVYRHYKSQVTDSTTDKELEQIFTEVLNLTNDPHTNLFAPSGVMGNTSYFDDFKINQCLLNDTLFEDPLISTHAFEYAIVKNESLGYLRIKTFVGDKAEFEAINSILPYFQNTQGLMIDVRGNLGGKISNCYAVAQHFTDSEAFTCRTRSRNYNSANGFTPWQDVFLNPAQGNIYSKAIVILTNRRTFSAAERFVISVKAIDNVVVVGDTTAGGSGTPAVCELSNGWILRTSNTQTKLPSGLDFQGIGIAPDITVSLSDADIENGNDVILNRAIEILK